MSEIEEVERLIASAEYPGVKQILQNYLKKLKEESIVPTIQPAHTDAVKDDKLSNIAPKTPSLLSTLKFIPIENYSWDQGSYNSPTIAIYIDLPGVGSAKDRVTVSFGQYSLDVQVLDVNGKNYRLVKDNLEKDIIPAESKYVVKKDKIVLKLQKVKGEYSYESWNQLTSKKPRDPTKEAEKKKDPQSSLMDMMKEMYDDGDANMKKIIGEAMLKSQRGDKMDPPKMPGMDDI